MMQIDVNRWYYSPDHRQFCQVIETQTLWGETTCRVWLPGRDSVVRIPASRRTPLESTDTGSPDNIAYIAAAARVAEALTQDILLAPIESSVIPLPHQIRALSRAVAGDNVRYLLADEVGLGKTVEAGLIMRELKLRGLVKKTLVIAPKGLVTQWVAEMQTHFNERFHLVLPEDIKTLRRISAVPGSTLEGAMFEDELSSNWNLKSSTLNPWAMFSQVVVPMDSIKPLDRRRGWTAAQVSEYNRERFEDLIAAGWDLVIVDEAHRLGGSTDQVARFKLGQGLAETSPYFLLLSATPHQGKTDAFHRLVSLIDAQEFPDAGSVTRERVAPYVIRTEKHRAIDAEGKPLFKPRRTELFPVSWADRHRDQKSLYDAVTGYVRESYNQAMKEKRSYIGFLMILMQRLVVSSTSAIRATLEKRLEALATPQDAEQLTLFPLMSEEEWSDLDGQEQFEVLLRTRLKALKNERAEVKLLLEAARRCEQAGPDAKADALLDWLYRLQSEEGDPELKVLVFTEFVPTQEMLQRFLTERGFSVVCLNGFMGMEERRRAQEAFAGNVRILLSTDAGGEGLNLQFCHVVINYDIPWNPMRLEQRIGRVDRIGQCTIVRAVNFVFEGSVEHRVREVLEQKLAVIFQEFGIDKTGDVLDSVQAGRIFDDMYVEAILNPEKVEDAVEGVVSHLQKEARDARDMVSVLGKTESLEPGEVQRLLSHPLPHWVERMTVSYLKANGGQAVRRSKGWNLTWPDGTYDENVVFTDREAEEFPTSRRLSLEEPRIRGLVMCLPLFVPRQPIPVVALEGISQDIRGIWSLWRIAISAMDWNRRRFMPLFLAESGAVLMPTARHVWDVLLVENVTVKSVLDSSVSQTKYQELQNAAELYGKQIYDTLVQEHKARMTREREKSEFAFAARQRMIERIGLPQVRNHRMTLLAQEEKIVHEQLKQKAHIYPDMVPLMMIRIGDL